MNGRCDRTRTATGPALSRRAFVLIGAAMCLSAVGRVQAHPLGNDSITHFNVLYVLPDRLEVDYLLDIAENPAQFIENNEMDGDKDGQVSREEQEAWLEAKVDQFATFIQVRVDETDLKLSLVPEQVDPASGRKMSTSKVIVPMLGPMGQTYRLVIRYVARYPEPLGPGEHVIRYEDKTYPQHVGLKLVLLEPTPVLCRLYDLSPEALGPGPISDELRDAFADEALPLAEPTTARLVEAPSSASGPRQWIVSDGKPRFALVQQPEAVDVFVLPYCQVLEPHPPFVSEDNAAFRYEQYDPMNLPDVRRAAVRFRIVDGSEGKIAADPASPPTPVTAGSADHSTTRPTVGDALPSHANSFLDPQYNPLQTSEYQRQARKMIDLLQGEWGILLLLVVAGTAFVWGADHALMPGHAKTVVAAYLISQRGTYWHAAMLAVIVTVTHTALVVIMGLVIWFYQRSNPRLAPKLQLWLGLIAGLLVVSMGLTLLWRAVSGRIAAHDHDHHHHGHSHGADGRSWWRKLFTHSHPHLPDHDHPHPHSHDHDHGHAHAHSHGHEHAHAHAHTHDHPHQHAHVHEHPHHHAHEHHHHAHGHTHSHVPAPAGARGGDQLTFRMLLVLGVTGGIVPCPSATIIMFLGIGANVVGGALFAIAVFSLGLALTLMLIGSLALASRRYAAKVLADARSGHELSGVGRKLLLQIVPALSGAAVTALGGMIAFHYICLMRSVPSPFPWMG